MGRAKLSVVLCSHNGEAYLRQQLDSLLRQTRLPDEVVVGDDDSTDGTWSILQDFGGQGRARGIEIRLLRRSPALGVVGNFSESLGVATGDIVFLCDQDDSWRPDKLATIEKRFASDPSLLLLWTDARLVDSLGRPLGATLFDALALADSEKSAVRDGRAFEILLRRSMATGATVALQRRALQSAWPVGEGWLHDEWLAVVLSAIGFVDMLEEQLIDYRQHERNEVGMRKRSWKDKWRGLIAPWRSALQREVARLNSLEQRLVALGSAIRTDALSQLASRREHLQRRIALGSQPRWRRLPSIWREARRGDYRRFDTGSHAMLRDMLRHD